MYQAILLEIDDMIVVVYVAMETLLCVLNCFYHLPT